MTPEHFATWLRGLLAGAGDQGLTPDHVKQIRRELDKLAPTIHPVYVPVQPMPAPIIVPMPVLPSPLLPSPYGGFEITCTDDKIGSGHIEAVSASAIH